MDKLAKVRAEIERLKNEALQKKSQSKRSGLERIMHQIGAYNKLLSFIDSLQEEPVSDDLEEAAEMFIDSLIPTEVNTVTPFAAEYVIELLNKAIEFGAQWQKEQFEKNRLAHCDALTEEQAQMESDFVTKHLKENNRTPTFIDAIEYGMRLQEKKDQETIELAEDHAMLAGMEKMKEEMIANSFYAEIDSSRRDGRCILGGNFARFETGNKVKVIVIKEDSIQ